MKEDELETLALLVLEVVLANMTRKEVKDNEKRGNAGNWGYSYNQGGPFPTARKERQREK